eukprot:gene9688-12961_t
MAAIGLGQSVAAGETEPAIVTAGEDLRDLRRFMAAGETSYGAADVLRFILGGSDTPKLASLPESVIVGSGPPANRSGPLSSGGPTGGKPNICKIPSSDCVGACLIFARDMAVPRRINFRVIPPSPRAAELKLTGLMGSLRCSQLFSGLPAEDLSAIAAFTVPQIQAK